MAAEEELTIATQVEYRGNSVELCVLGNLR